MSDDDLASLAAIRERLRHIELSLQSHARESTQRAEKLDGDLRELTRTVVRLSEAITTITVRLNVAGTSAGSQITPAVTAGSAGGGLAIAIYYLLKSVGL